MWSCHRIMCACAVKAHAVLWLDHSSIAYSLGNRQIVELGNRLRCALFGGTPASQTCTQWQMDVSQITCFRGTDIVPHHTHLTALQSLELRGAYYEHDDAPLAVLNYWPPSEIVAPALTRLAMCNLREPHLADLPPGLSCWRACRCSRWDLQCFY